MPLRTRRVHEDASPDDGFRLLTMRFWPRGVRKDRVDAWEKELGPSPRLLGKYRNGDVDWPEFERLYRSEMEAKGDLLDRWARRARDETVTLLCGCRDAALCHRTILASLLEERISSI
ncbi:MAG: DUF488 family protein [Planctomycetota bacterium]|nr:DUF488 family protein [Planctomycetota bacterium]